MKCAITSLAVQTRRAKVPTLIEYTFVRALMLDLTIKVSPMTPDLRSKMRTEWYRRVATLMSLDKYSAMHPFDKGDVEIDPELYPECEVIAWWDRYKHLAPSLLADMIWAEVDL